MGHALRAEVKFNPFMFRPGLLRSSLSVNACFYKFQPIARIEIRCPKILDQHQLIQGRIQDFLLGGGAPLRNDVTDRLGKQIFKANTKKKASSQGGAHPLHPLPRSAPVIYSEISNLISYRTSSGLPVFQNQAMHKEYKIYSCFDKGCSTKA